MEYTNRVDGFQITDVSYLGIPPKDVPPQFDIVKWESFEPREMTCVKRVDGKWVSEKHVISESCFSVGTLIWNRHEGDFRFESVGMRWLEEKPTEAVIDMVLKFAEAMGKKISEEEECR